MAYGDFKDLSRTTAAYYVIRHLMLLKIKTITDISADLLQWFMEFFDKKFSGSCVTNN